MKLLLVSTFEVFGDKIDKVFGDELSKLNVLCIPTAAYGEVGYEDWLEPEKAPIKERVKSFLEFDIAGKTSSELEQAIEGVDVIYVTGGNTYYLLEQMQKCDFEKTVRKHLAQGGYYFGCSAGSILTCPNIDFIGDMDSSDGVDLESFEAMRLIDFYVMPHLDHPKYGSKAKTVIDEMKSDNKIFGLEDNQGLYINENYMKVY
jgi:dipeptidase E